MNRNDLLVYAAALLVLALSAADAEPVNWRPCPRENTVCTIHEVRVEPCSEAAENKPCNLKRGRNASISFDYTTEFVGPLLQTRAYWASEIMDLPFLGLPLDACSSTVCPVTAGERQTYMVEMPIYKKFPARTYSLKWKLWKKDDEQQECCFMFNIKLVK